MGRVVEIRPINGWMDGGQIDRKMDGQIDTERELAIEKQLRTEDETAGQNGYPMSYCFKMKTI